MTRSILVAFFLLSLVQRAGATIYGTDNRRDLYEESDPRVAALARGVVAIFDDYNVTVQDGKVRLKTTPYGKSRDLDPNEKFYSQPDGAICSGVLVGPDLVLTAGHCVADNDFCHSIRLVFDYELDRADADPTISEPGKIYRCRKVVAARNPKNIDDPEHDADGGADWSLLRLDRPVLDRRPISAIDASRRQAGDPLIVMGFGSGLPLKIARGCARAQRTGRILRSDLNTSDSSSGGPVFDAASGALVGLVSRGNRDDFEPIPGSLLERSHILPPGAGLGTGITEAAAFAPYVKEALTPVQDLAGAVRKIGRFLAGRPDSWTPDGR